MKKGRMHRVNEVARLSSVSVRALHHYDEIGLLKPSSRSVAGYRLYSDADLLRLQQIVIARELGMPLEVIRKSLDDPSFDRRSALRSQRSELIARAERTQQMLNAIDVALAALEGELTMQEMTEQQRTALFDGFDPGKFENETRERWGNTDAFKESSRRTKHYTRSDWERYKAESHRIMQEAAQLWAAGTSSDSPEAQAIAEEHRLLIDRWFYPCSKSMHASLAEMYEADERFTQSIDEYGKGLTPWFAAAIRQNGVTG